jgi:CRISP-associated protein Cas1
LAFGLPEEAISILDGHIDLQRAGRGAVLYLQCLAAARRDDSFSKVLAAASPDVRNDPDTMRTVAAHAWNIGDLAQAELQPADLELEDDDISWATRSGMWQKRIAKASARRTKRAKAQPTLILAGHGVSLRVENGALTIKNGFTHYPQKREIIRYFRGDVVLPERIILLDGSGSISLDVLSWLAEQKMSLIRIDWKGDIVCVVGASGYSANPFRVRWQLETRENTQQRNEFCRSLIARKIEATIITLEKSIPRSDKWERAMKSAYAGLSRLEESPPENISELRALEANCRLLFS